MSWISKVDFAWVGSDRNNNVAMFYVDEMNIPNVVCEKYNEQLYSEITGFIIDELPVVSDPPCPKHWARYDSSRGLFVFEFDQHAKMYKKICDPSIAITVDSFPKSDGIIDCRKFEFRNVDFLAVEYLDD